MPTSAPGGGATPSATLIRIVKAGARGYTWAAVTITSIDAASLELRTGTAVMAIGGFSGSDPALTLASFESLVRTHHIHWFVASGLGDGGGARPGAGASSITSWVTARSAARTVGGETVYDLSQPATG